MERGHAFAWTALFDHGANLVAAFVIERQRGANQVRTRIAALRGGAMAKAAVADEDLLATLNGRGIGNRAADEHIAAGTRRGGGWGLSGDGSRGKQRQGHEYFHATGYCFTFQRRVSTTGARL